MNTYDVYETNSITGKRGALLGSIKANTEAEARKGARAKWGLIPAKRPGGHPKHGPSMEVVAVEQASGETFVSATELAAAKAAKEKAEAEQAKHAAALAASRAAKELAESELAKLRLELELEREKALKLGSPAVPPAAQDGNP